MVPQPLPKQQPDLPPIMWTVANGWGVWNGGIVSVFWIVTMLQPLKKWPLYSLASFLPWAVFFEYLPYGFYLPWYYFLRCAWDVLGFPPRFLDRFDYHSLSSRYPAPSATSILLPRVLWPLYQIVPELVQLNWCGNDIYKIFSDMLLINRIKINAMHLEVTPQVWSN